MKGSRKLLLVSGLALSIWGMAYGLWYAVFAEHQQLVAIGASISNSFVAGARRDAPAAQAALDTYQSTKFVYVRHVHIHSHWGGLATLLFLFGAIFHHVGFSERVRMLLAASLSVGGVLYPAAIALQISMSGPLPGVLAAIGAGLVILGMTGAAVGFARGPSTGTKSDGASQ